MYIYKRINFDQFAQAFKAVRPDNFSTAGLSELYDYLESLAEDSGEPIELDVIALCCDFSEDTLSEVNDADATTDEIFEALTDQTLALRVDADTVVYQVF